ncbi:MULTISPECIES: Ldh family oxidoreductase [unclassified Herbaspirillum]|uniref:Ldh family oxidoreductase n=1 Tax=unclassified Herbaspirillum TaxID=2624150 RepID=UPI000E2F7624|nr:MULTISPECIES: Ldh family oxidoreductase [unclassified Herbaspirillum]RFB71181.1 Ldh family oxidoreductase [Herbaspirillum sp. 3R-3a1]TFI08282.1 Ldh family oxidoreductase [Herbaspirillum sp. 3R11]TFI14697.1 Ldh family oxidoreductase [Herbaspirillum sp. 3R-11]TFI31911.1 Ldh family oxidoreductase [Herbaspirillum sp. 3C11]TFI32006.1 Ldh family oxidoreductase [Herbaspirillum sp. 3C11]
MTISRQLTEDLIPITEHELTRLVTKVLLDNGVVEQTAKAVAGSMVAAERDGTFSHGLERLDAMVQTLKSGWITPGATPSVIDQAPGVVIVDATNGFAQGALAAAHDLVIEKAKEQGIASLCIKNSHHFGALWVDVEPFADEGLIAMAFVHSRSRIVGPGAKQKVLGTNPMAFAAPMKDGNHLVWDQASSVMAHGDVLIAANEQKMLPPGCGVDKEGKPTTDPNAVLDGGALVPFGDHKGFLIAMMVEIMAAGLTGSVFGYQDQSMLYKGAHTSKAGQSFIVIDPRRAGIEMLDVRVRQLADMLVATGTKRLPGQRRYERRRLAELQGMKIQAKHFIQLQSLANS